MSTLADIRAGTRSRDFGPNLSFQTDDYVATTTAVRSEVGGDCDLPERRRSGASLANSFHTILLLVRSLYESSRD
jgi:hypothetical protein